MTDQTFQPGSGDPTQTTSTSQGGVFGGAVVEETAKSNISDTSALFAETEELNKPVAPFAGDFPTFDTIEPTTPTVRNPFAEEVVAPVEEVLAPVEEVLAPVEEVVAPVEEVVAPVEEVVAPVEEVVAPVEEVIAPVEEVVAPVEEVIAPVEEIIAPVEEVVAPVEEVIAPVEEVVAPVEEVVAPVEEVVAPVEEVVSDIKAKYDELANTVEYLMNANNGISPEVVGSNTDSSHVDYRFHKEDNLIDITKIETSKIDPDEVNENTISFVYDEEEKEVSVFLDDVLLYEEHDLTEDSKKKMQVMDKLNKFIFLSSEKMKDLEKARKAKEAEEAERRRLQDIFRNF